MKKLLFFVVTGVFIANTSLFAAAVPYGEIASVLREADQVTNLISSISSSAGKTLEPYANSVKSMGTLILGVEQLEKDLTAAREAAKAFPWIIKCAKKPAGARKTFSAGGKLVCAAPTINCAGTRAQCLKQALANLRIMLKPLLTDLFIGYELNGQKVQGLTGTILDVVQQQEAKQKLEATLDVMKTILTVINSLENLIKV